MEHNIMKRLLINASLVAVTVFLMLALLEVGVRVFTKPVYPILRTDREVGTIMKPNVREYVWHNEPQKEVLVLTNSLGYVGEKTPAATTSDIRVALLGDSTTASIEVDYFRAFPYLLEQSLNATRKTSERPVEILNYGIGGTGTFLQYQRYKRDVAPYHPDYVVLMFSDNDFTDNLNKIDYDPERYAEGSGRNIFLKEALLHFQLPKFIFGKLQHNISFLRMLHALGLYELNEYTERVMSHGTDIVKEDPAYYDFTFDLIRKMRTRVEADGARFIVVRAAVPKQRNMDEWRRDSDNKKLEEFLKTEHIPFIVPGLSPNRTIESAFPDPAACINWGCVGHLNEEGHRIMTRLLYPEFREILFGTRR